MRRTPVGQLSTLRVKWIFVENRNWAPSWGIRDLRRSSPLDQRRPHDSVLFVVGLEIKRELVAGELRGWRRAALPATAALGGMAIPPLIYVALNAGSDNLSRWDIPMATDIAFAVGCSCWSPDKPLSSLKTLLLGIAIVDDIGAIVCH
jgi:hypothetical protein